MDTLDRQVQSLRITQSAMVVTVFILALLGEFVLHPSSHPLGTAAYVIVAISAPLLALAYGIRNSMVPPIEETLRRTPADMVALMRWRSYLTLSLMLCEGVGLLGFVLRLLGGPPILAFAMYAISVAYLFILAPKKP